MIPADWSPSPIASSENFAIPFSPRKGAILVVDDERLVRALLEEALRRQGFEVWQAADGLEAIALYRRHGDDIAVTLLDVQMPKLDGPHTLKALRQLNPVLACCFMSGIADAYPLEDLRAMGVATVFAKPFDLSEVIHVLEKLAAR